MINALYDTEFLENLVKENLREIYVRISALDNNDYPLEQIEGKVTDGSINVDGKSLIRRTCNLTMTAEDVNINAYYWGLKNKFTLEIGLKNNIDPIYPSIIWFLLGTFIITQFNTTQTTNKWTIKILGKDKMCLLNGEVSGNLPHEVDFGKEEYHDLTTDTVTYTYTPVKNIIRRIVQEFGGERPENIIINDIDDSGLILLEYINENPAYLYKEIESDEYKNIILDGDIECLYPLKHILSQDEYLLIPEKYDFLKNIYVLNDYGYYIFNENLATQEYYSHLVGGLFKGTISDAFSIVYENLLEDLDYIEDPTEILFVNNTEKKYTLAKIEYGDIPGYFLTELTYASAGSNNLSKNDLIAKTGESLTSVLNKIRDMLVHFEYYYDINGKFIFLKKKDYVKMPWNNLGNDDLEYEVNLSSQNMMFSFLDSILISSFTNTPKLTNIKNDYSVWGSYNNSGTEIPIHMRYAIDKKPIEYRPIRPLKEEIHTIIKNGETILSDTLTYKYYDAPEIEPYDDELLIKITDENDTINGVSVTKIIGTTLEGYTTETIIYPYFAKIPYSVEDIYEITYKDSITIEGNKSTAKKINLSTLLENFEKLNIYLNFDNYVRSMLSEEEYNLFCDIKILRHKVDWRELIYLMALDYRKYNYHDDFLYYLTLFNSLYPSGITGYELYYIDIEGFWRELYNPNPPLHFESIQFNEVKKYTQLIDSNTENDIYDAIYIEEGYRPIEFNDITYNLSPVDLYCFSTPENGTKKLYPYIGSENCHLGFEQGYYINENNKMATYTSKKKSDSGYEKLNSVTLNNIYIKNEKFFLVLTNTEKPEYYTVYHSVLDNGNINNRKFKVPAYPSNSGLDKYSDDYFKITDVAFDKLLQSNPTLENYYIKNQEPIKLLDIYNYNNWFKDNYYNSNLVIFAYQALNLLLTLQTLDISNYENINKITYLEDCINAIQDYVLKMNQYNNADIINSLIEELNSILITSISHLITFADSFPKRNSITRDSSCLISILEHFKENLEDISLLNINTNTITPIVKLNFIKNVYTTLINNITDINTNWTLSKYILNLIDELKTVSTSDDPLLTIKNALNNLKTYFEGFAESTLYEDGQVKLAINQINTQLSKINSFVDGDLDTFINERIQEIEEFIIHPVQVIESFLNFAYEEEEADNSLILYLTTVVYEDFYLYLNCVKLLTRLLLDIKFTREIISGIISYTRTGYLYVIVLQELNDIVNRTYNDALLNKAVQEYVETTKDFLEYLITNTVNNFNHIESDLMQYEKIKYVRGVYNYYRDKINGNFWTYDIETSPQLLTFWFDFLDADKSLLANISASTIGNRTKVITDKNVKAINYKTVPQVIFKRIYDKNFERKDGYTYININNNTESFFRTSSKSKSAKERIEELLYDHSYCADNITIATIPVYHLEPNHHILIRDDKSNIDGEYIITKMTIPLSYKKTMNITASKAVTNII